MEPMRANVRGGLSSGWPTSAPAGLRPVSCASISGGQGGVGGEEGSGASGDTAGPVGGRKRRRVSGRGRGSAPGRAGGGTPLAGTNKQRKARSTSPPSDPSLPSTPARARPASKAATQAGRQLHYSQSMRMPALEEDDNGVVVLSWNVAGLRALLRKEPEALADLIRAEKPGIICLQETKLQEMHVNEIEDALQLGSLGYTPHWRCAVKPSRLGYSGVAVFVNEGLSATVGTVECPEVLEDVDPEGRVLTVELPDFYVVCVYVPNAGSGLKRLEFRTESWDSAFAEYLKALNARKPVVLAGDLNVAREEMDLHSPKTNLRSAGFTQEERNSFATKFLGGVGLVDTFRQQHPDVIGYTYWSYMRQQRQKNQGWRIDYVMVTEELRGHCHDSFVLPHVMGSDHCPVGLVLKKPTSQ